MVAESVLLRPIEDGDIRYLHKLLNDSYNQQLVGGSLAPMSESQVVAWLQGKRTANDIYQFAIEDSAGKFCGYVQLASINRVDGHAILGINILREFHGKGIGKLAIQEIHAFARDVLLLRKIFLHVRADNEAATRLYSKLGYRQVGSLERHIKSGSGYIDLQIMEILF